MDGAGGGVRKRDQAAVDAKRRRLFTQLCRPRIIVSTMPQQYLTTTRIQLVRCVKAYLQQFSFLFLFMT